MNLSQLMLLAVSIAVTQIAVAAEQQPESPDTQYLYIEKFTVPAGRTISEAMEEGKRWVRSMRGTGDFKSVRLFFHHTGPEVAIYIHAEPKNWASIETGFQKVLEEMDVMGRPFNWGGHSDNVLSEIPVD